MSGTPTPARPPIRALFLQAVFTIFLAVVVFVILTYFFVIPRLLDHEQRVSALESDVIELSEAAEEPEPEAADDAADAPDAGPPPVMWDGVPATP